jgi:hypothetical protein
MSSIPTASRNDAAASGSISNHQQQQQGPLQQRPLLSPPPTPGSLHTRHYNHQQVTDSSSTNASSNENQSLDYNMNSTRGSYGGSNVNINGYMNYNASSDIGGESTIERQRSTPTQQQTMTPNQMANSPYRTSATNPSYNNHSLYPNGSTTDVAISNNTSTRVVSSPLRHQQQHKTIPVGQPIPSPQQLMQIQSHQHNQMKLQEQLHQQNQHHYQQYQNTSQGSSINGGDNINSIQTQLQTDSHANLLPQHGQTLTGNNSNYQNIQSDFQFHNINLDGNAMNPMPLPMNLKGQYQSQILHNKNNSSVTASGIQASSNAGTTTIAPTSATTAKLSSPKATTLSSKNSSNKNTTSNNNNNSSNVGGVSTTAIQQLPPEKVAALLSRCTWVDKTIWASRQLLGGQAVNGFMRATATVQRIKKQRARQNVKSGKSKVNASVNANTNANLDNGGDSVKAASSGITPTAPVTGRATSRRGYLKT